MKFNFRTNNTFAIIGLSLYLDVTCLIIVMFYHNYSNIKGAVKTQSNKIKTCDNNFFNV